jgi:hypothetical protein
MIFDEFEHRKEKLLPLKQFYIRLMKFALLSLAIIMFSLAIGVFGYMALEGMGPVEAFINAAMLMGGMGPVDVLHTDVGKIFAGLYAMYCGFILLVSVGIFIAPIFHRFLHHFHLEETPEEQ